MHVFPRLKNHRDLDTMIKTVERYHQRSPSGPHMTSDDDSQSYVEVRMSSQAESKPLIRGKWRLHGYIIPDLQSILLLSMIGHAGNMLIGLYVQSLTILKMMPPFFFQVDTSR